MMFWKVCRFSSKLQYFSRPTEKFLPDHDSRHQDPTEFYYRNHPTQKKGDFVLWVVIATELYYRISIFQNLVKWGLRLPPLYNTKNKVTILWLNIRKTLDWEWTPRRQASVSLSVCGVSPPGEGEIVAFVHITKIGRTVRGLSDPPHHRRRHSVRGPIV